MKRLNLIGNGFDLYHGLPCAYYHFGCYLAKNYPEFYGQMAKMFGFAYLKRCGYSEDDTEFVVDNYFWKTFEEKLGELDPTWLEESLQDDLGLECQDPVELEVLEVVNSQIIVNKFAEWIANVVNTRANFEKIENELGRNRLSFNKDDYFINFNYTQILEEVYKVARSKVFHIHGECDLDVENEHPPLIVGHGNMEQIILLENSIKGINKNGVFCSSQAERNRMSEYKAELQVLKDLRKNVDSLLCGMKSALRTHSVIPDEIWVWGLSCGDVDKPYIESLVSLYPDAKWQFSYYDDNEKNSRKIFSNKLGIINVGYFHLANKDSDSIRDDILTEYGIEKLDTN